MVLEGLGGGAVGEEGWVSSTDVLVGRAAGKVPFVFHGCCRTHRADAGATGDIGVVDSAASFTFERERGEAEAGEGAYEVAVVGMMPEAVLGRAGG